MPVEHRLPWRVPVRCITAGLRHCALAAGVVLLAAAGAAHGAGSRLLGIDDLAARAELVVVGSVTAVESGWNADRTRIETHVDVRVEAAPAGWPRPDVVSVWQPGGRAGGVAAEIEGMPRFAVGERVLLFLRRGADGRPHVVERFQGKFTVGRDAGGSEQAVRREPDTGRVLDAHPLNRVLSRLTKSP